MKEFSHSHPRYVSSRNICLCALLVGAWFVVTLRLTESSLASLGLWTGIPLQDPPSDNISTPVEERGFQLQEGPDIFSPKDLVGELFQFFF